MKAIFKREFRSSFSGMMGWLLTAFLTAASALYFFANNLGFGLPDFGYYTLYQTLFVLLVYVPVLAMRSFAEEKHSRTDQLLLTSPVSVWGIVLGKFLAMCAVFALPCLVDVILILVLRVLGCTNIALLSNFSSLLCYYLVGCAAIAICEFLSSLTENQIIAAVLGFGALLLAYLMPGLQSLFSAGSVMALVVFTVLAAVAAFCAGLRSRSFTLGCLLFAALAVGIAVLFTVRSAWLTTAFSSVLGGLALFQPFEDFVNGSFSVPALVYYISAAELFLFFTAQGIEKRRWN